MYRIRPNYCALIVFVGILFTSNTVRTMEIEPSVSLATQYTNNSRRVTFNRDDEVIRIASVGANINDDTGPFQLEANTSLKYTDYAQNTFENKHYFNLNTTANWTMWKDQLDWKLQDFFTQQPIISLDSDTPDNIQDTNVLTFGPNIHYRISGKQLLTINPEYRKFTYEIQNTDNRQNSLEANWTYQLSRTLNVGVRVGENKVNYENPLLTDNSFKNIHLTLSATRPGYDYSADLGSTHVERDSGDTVLGITGNMNWVFNITGSSSLRAYIASDLSDSNSSLLDSSINPDNGGFSNIQISSEVMRNRIFRLSYQSNGRILQSNIWSELRNQDYEFALLDQEVKSAGFDVTYPLTALLHTGIETRYNHIIFTDVDRKNTQYSIAGNIKYRWNRKLHGVMDLKYKVKKDSSIGQLNYRDTSVFISLVYGYNS